MSARTAYRNDEDDGLGQLDEPTAAERTRKGKALVLPAVVTPADQAEREVVGGLLVITEKPVVVELLGKIPGPDLFRLESSKRMFITIRDIMGRGEPLSIANLMAEFKTHKWENSVRVLYVDFCEEASSIAACEVSLKILLDDYRLRTFHEKAARVQTPEGVDAIGEWARASQTTLAENLRPIPVDLEAFQANGIEPVPWLLQDWIAEGDLVILGGGPFVGKSTLCYDMAQALSTPRPWLGMEPARAIRVMVCDEEMGTRAAARLMLRLGGHNPNLRLFSCAGFELSSPEGLTAFEREIQDFKPQFVVFDSWSHLMGAIESENDAAQVSEVFRRLHYIRETYKTGFLIVDHRPKWNRFGTPSAQELLDLILRGSSVKAAQASAVFGMIRIDDTQAELRQAKRREGDHLLSLRVGYSIGDDDHITLENLGTPEDAFGAEGAAAGWILDHIGQFGRLRRKQITDAGVAAGFKSRTLERALTAEKLAGRIVQPKYGEYCLAVGANLAESLAKSGLFAERPSN
jgi:hypothetical protein